MKSYPLSAFTSIICIVMSLIGCSVSAAERPNILWLSCEDISAHLGCYGYDNAKTPVLDEFAKQSTLFEHAYTTAGVCSPCRSAIITGLYQTSIGTHHMRCEARLPSHVKPFTHWLRKSGYYCTNSSKQDYQFKTPKGTWDESSGKAHWKKKPNTEQPFFSVFNYTGCHESGIANTSKYETVTKGIDKCDRDKVAASLPPYYPNTPETRDDWGRYYDVITAMDVWVGDHLKQLDDAGLTEDTIVVYWSDHGVGLPRAKRWLYESGTHVPLIIRVPKKWQQLAGTLFQPGTRTKRLVSMIDLGPSMISLAGVEPPKHMTGQAFMGPAAKEPRRYVFGARDRMDERYDIIRMVRDQRYRYVRNYEPYKTWYQHMNTPEKGRTMKEIRKAAAATPSETVAQFLKARKPLEELYDVNQDPHELHNLAADPRYSAKLEELRQQHLNWVVSTRDLGLIPEAELHRLRETAGSEWAILNKGDNVDQRMTKIRDAATIAGGIDAESMSELMARLKDSDATVRYWAATGIGNRYVNKDWETDSQAAKLRDLATTLQDELSSPLVPLLADQSANTRVAAARAIMLLSKTRASREAALQSLVRVLDNGTQWARVHAAIVLDELETDASPVLSAMKRNKAYRDGFVAKGKYTVRVLNKALNDLEGTRNTVP